MLDQDVTIKIPNEPERDVRKAILDLIECAEMVAAQCRTSGDNAHAMMYELRAARGRTLLFPAAQVRT